MLAGYPPFIGKSPD
jgi:serine/threonine protein kinase